MLISKDSKEYIKGKYTFCHYVSFYLIFEKSTSNVSRTRTKFLVTSIDLIKRYWQALIEGVGQFSAAKIKKSTCQGDSVLLPLKVYGFNIIRIKLCKETKNTNMKILTDLH